MNADSGTKILRIHLPEWRDSLAVNQEIRRALRAGIVRIHLTGARGDRLLLNGLSGTEAGTVRIDGDIGTELARDLDMPALVVFVHGSVGSGACMGMKAGTVFVTGTCGALLGSRMSGGTIWATGPVGNRAGHRSSGGVIRAFGPVGSMTSDRSEVATIEPASAEDPESARMTDAFAESARWAESVS